MKSKTVNILVKITIFVYICTIPNFAFFTCPKEFLYQIGINATCESEDQQTIPCDGSHPLHIKRVFIDCTEEYFNNKSRQRISCDTETGEWFPQPIQCFHHCDKSGEPEKIELLNNKTEYPWYTEIIKNPYQHISSGCLDEIFPGLILNGRMVITWEKYFDNETNWKLANYVVRIYDSPNKYEDFKIDHIEYVSSDPVYSTNRSTKKYESFCVLVLTDDNYIKITEKHRPPCLDHELFSNNKWFVEVVKAIPENNLRPNYPKQCIVPKVDEKNIEVACYESISSPPLETCPDQVPVLQTRCRYEYEKPYKTTLALCVANRWRINNDNCKLMCGNTDDVSNNYNDSRKSEIIKAPWHVAIYSNKTNILTPYDQSCSGVIIDENIILSAAHCFYDKEERRIKDSSIYLIVAGKSYSNSFKERKISEQYGKIKKIHIPITYFGKENSIEDVAVIILKSSLIFNSYVKPICIDLYSNSVLKSETPGYMFGWRIIPKDEDIINNNLQEFDIRAIIGKQCISTDTQKKKVVPGKFCNLKEIFPGICKGDSGGGFFTKETIGSKERYILRGIISTDISNEQYCTNSSVIVFTDLQYQQEFLKKVITETRDTPVKGIEIWDLVWHRIYAHNVTVTPNWIRKEFNFRFLKT